MNAEDLNILIKITIVLLVTFAILGLASKLIKVLFYNDVSLIFYREHTFIGASLFVLRVFAMVLIIVVWSGYYVAQGLRYLFNPGLEII